MLQTEFLITAQSRVNNILEQLLPLPQMIPVRLHEAMRYSALNPGKRIRPALVYATGKMLAADSKNLDMLAAAVELIHAYSLIHDDLPCMDDDNLRRGIPTCHIKYDEATAVLAGDALQTLAFEVISNTGNFDIPSDKQLAMMHTLTQASGSIGMGGGQAIDLLMTDSKESEKYNIEALENMHRMKTGALISASVKLGFLASDCEDQVLMSHLDSYSRALGLAFQIRDDILDIEGDTQTLGKPQGSDLKKNKMTFPSLLGLDGAKLRADELVASAIEALERIPLDTDNLADFAKYIVSRQH